MRLFVFLFCVSFSVLVLGQKIKVGLPEPERESIELEIVNNTILVPVTLNNVLKGYFILDSGVNNIILTEPIISSSLPLIYEREILVKGYGKQPPIEGLVANGLSYQVGTYKRRYAERVVLLKKSLKLDEAFDLPVYGLIGYTFLKEHRVSLNFRQKTMTIHSSKKGYRPSRKYQAFLFRFAGSKPIIDLELKHNGQELAGSFLVDTGFSGAVTIFPQHDSLLTDSDDVIHNYVGMGLNGHTLNRFFKADEFRIGKHGLKNVATILPDEEYLQNVTIFNEVDGSIGNELLRRFSVIIDYPNKMLYLKKNRDFRHQFYYNASGILLRSISMPNGRKNLEVHFLQDGSAASKTGLQLGDELIEVDGKEVKTLEKAYRLLNNFSSPKRLIKVKRKGVELNYLFEIDTRLLD